MPFLETALKKVIRRKPWQSCQRYLPRSGEFWTIHVSLSLQIKQISTLFQSAKYTPQYYPTQAHCFIRYDCSLIKGFLFAINFNNKRSQWTKLAFSRQLSLIIASAQGYWYILSWVKKTLCQSANLCTKIFTVERVLYYCILHRFTKF